VPTPNAIPTPTPVAVPSQVPQLVAQPGLAVPTPTAIPTPTPVAVPSQVPQIVAQPSLAVPTPTAIPPPTPVAVPSQVPQIVAQPGLAVPTPTAIPTPTPLAVPSQVPQTVASTGNPAGWFYLAPRAQGGAQPRPVPYSWLSRAHGLVNPDGSLTQHATDRGWVRLPPVGTPALQQEPPQPGPMQVPQLVAQPSQAMPTPTAIPTPTPVAVPPMVPQLVAQPSLAVPTPNAIPTPTPVAVPLQVPQAVSAPYLVPHQVPRPTPIRQPVKVLTLIAARPSGQQPTGQTPVGTPSSRPAIVTPLPGRQPAHALPIHRASADAIRRTCLASGFGWRKLDDGNGNTRRAGLAPVLYTPDMLMHDLPANHPRHAECLIVVDRRFED
jgi:hypothetical protein